MRGIGESPIQPQIGGVGREIGVSPRAEPAAIKETSRGALDTLKRVGITATGFLPFSTRGVAFNVIKTPMRLAQSTYSGISSAVQNKSIQSFGSTFASKMEKYAKRDWSGGITDVYTRLDPTDAKARTIANDNLPYAKYMYRNNLGNAEPVSSRSMVQNPQIKQMQPMLDRLKSIGFEENKETGIFFHRETGSCFTLVHDNTKNELVLCFQGLGHEGDVQGKDKEAVGGLMFASHLSAVTDFFGGVNKSALQAMDLGKILKEESSKLGVTPKVVGHSHGGGLAQAAALANGLEAVVFNSRPMGAGVRRYIGQSTVAKNADKIIAFSGKGDYLSSCTSLNVLAKVMERVTGMVLPRTVGREFDLPASDIIALENKENMKKNVWANPNDIKEVSYFRARLLHHCDFCGALEVVANGKDKQDMQAQAEAYAKSMEGRDIYGKRLPEGE